MTSPPEMRTPPVFGETAGDNSNSKQLGKTVYSAEEGLCKRSTAVSQQNFYAGRKRSEISSVSEFLRQDYLLDSLDGFRSHTVSMAEAVWRGDYSLASVHWDCLRLIGKEITATLSEIQGGRS
jgi:hypothetical protein